MNLNIPRILWFEGTVKIALGFKRGNRRMLEAAKRTKTPKTAETAR
jgi:hypothetical protein